MEKTAIQKGASGFRPRARLIKTIGEDLISNDIVAIIELVKNAYDADADIVEITIDGIVEEVKDGKKKKKQIQSHTGSISIYDDGSGMDLQVIKSAWMEPATISKKSGLKKSIVKSRKFTGEKGIGRFASAKLSSTLKMYTKSEDDNEVCATFNWNDFSDESKYLDQIKCDWEVREPQTIDRKGTLLVLEGINSSWDYDKIKELRIALSRLINPVQPVLDFLIDLKLPREFEDLAGDIEAPDTVNKPDYYLKGNVDNNGKAKIEYKSKFEEETITYFKNLIEKPGYTPTSGSFSFEFRVWDRENDSLEKLAKDIDSTKKNIRADLTALGGVSVYRDNFRVLPYGELKNDWLRLDLRRVQNPTLRLSNNQIIGFVSVSLVQNNELTDQSNREGIVDSKSFNDLQIQIKSLLNEIEQKRYNERRVDDPEEVQKGLFHALQLTDFLTTIKSKLSDDKEAVQLIEQTQKKYDSGVKRVKAVLSRYRRLSTLGLLADSILHDGNNYIGKIDMEATLLQIELNKEKGNSNVINEKITNIKTLRASLSQLFKRLEPFGGKKKGRPKDIIIEHSIQSIFQLHKYELINSKIDYNLPTTNTMVRIDEGDLQTILVNLVQNSIHWLNTTDKQKNIDITVEKSNGTVSLVFSDNGPGINEDNYKSIFDPYFSTKSDGIGLGLTIVGEIVSEYNGELTLINDGPLEGASFCATFNKKV